MAETKINISVYRKKTVEEFSAMLADPNDRMDCGSAAAATGSIAASLLSRAAKLSASKREKCEELDWLVRNSEILRTYMVNLIDEDVKCRAPLRRSMKEGDPQRIEASRQAAVSICLEIVNMMGTCLELAEKLTPYSDSESMPFIVQCAELAYGASQAAGNYILTMSGISSDDTYRYVMKRENELTMQRQREAYNRILSSSH